MTPRPTQREAQVTDDSDSPGALFAESLIALSAVASENLERWRRVKQRSEELLGALADGRSVAELVRGESPPRIVELVTENIAALKTAGATVRRAEAAALHDRNAEIARRLDELIRPAFSSDEEHE